jgi:RNA polymerase sigma factor (sigma-70 family)
MQIPRPRLKASQIENPSDLLARARRLDRNAMSLLHDQHYPEIYRYTAYRLDQPQACEEITAQVFLKFLEALRKRRAPRKNLPGWLLKTAATLVNERLKQAPTPPGGNLSLQTPDSPTEAEKQRQKMYRALHALPLEQQHFLAVRFSTPHNLNEMAILVDKPEHKVRVLQQRSLMALHKQLGGLI